MISFNNLEVGHLPKQQVIASDRADQHCAGGSASWKLVELSSSILTTLIGRSCQKLIGEGQEPSPSIFFIILLEARHASYYYRAAAEPVKIRTGAAQQC
jgi:hypothetical protein